MQMTLISQLTVLKSFLTRLHKIINYISRALFTVKSLNDRILKLLINFSLTFIV